MAINSLTVRRLNMKRKMEAEAIRAARERPVTKTFKWVLCWGRIDYRTGIWEWKNEHYFENRTAAIANKNSFLRYPVDDQNACYVVGRYTHENENPGKAMESIR